MIILPFLVPLGLHIQNLCKSKLSKIVDNKVGSDLSNDVVVVENEDEEETTATEGEQPK
ncbi:unnamed protein product, partial [Prunus brigantina]